MSWRLGKFDNEAMAQIARMRLEDQGIRAELIGGSLTGLEGWPIAYSGVQLLVAEQDYERARRILAGENPPESELQA